MMCTGGKNLLHTTPGGRNESLGLVQGPYGMNHKEKQELTQFIFSRVIYVIYVHKCFLPKLCLYIRRGAPDPTGLQE